MPVAPWPASAEVAGRGARHCQTLAAGAALVTFSGDSLFGGPQAGVIVGHAELDRALRQAPARARAMRPGRSRALRAAAAGAGVPRQGTYSLRCAPFWRMATTPLEELTHRADARRYGDGRGARWRPRRSPAQDRGLRTTIPSAGLAVDGDRLAALRAHDPPVITRTVDGRTVLDLRTVDPADDAVLVESAAVARSSNTEPYAPRKVLPPGSPAHRPLGVVIVVRGERDRCPARRCDGEDQETRSPCVHGETELQPRAEPHLAGEHVAGDGRLVLRARIQTGDVRQLAGPRAQLIALQVDRRPLLAPV